MPVTPVQAPVSQPLGPATIGPSGTTVTIDTYVNPPTRIPAIIRNLVASNEGYFAETVFSTPGFTVEGGAVIYEELTTSTAFFLPPGQSLAPRAPGAEAPRLGAERLPEKIALPESWSGSIEVTDEARRRNKVLGVQKQFMQASNTLTDIMNRRALETLSAFATASGKQVEGGNWREAHAEGLWKTDPMKLPLADLALVQKTFALEKLGVMPDTIILHPNDALYLTVLTASPALGITGGMRGMFSEFGIKNVVVSPHADEGDPYFLKAGAVGIIAFEQPLSQEQTREGTRKTDVYVLEATPVFVAYDATAVLQLTKIDS